MSTDKETRLIPLDLLDPHPKNYRRHPEAQINNLAESLKVFGQVKPIAVRPQKGKDKGRYTILAGHGLTTAAKNLGYPEIECVVVPASWSDTKCAAFIAADNQGGYDDDKYMLTQLLEEIHASGEIKLEATGFTVAALDALLLEIASEGALEFDNEPEPFDNAERPDGDADTSAVTGRTRSGQIWQLGNHYLVVGDSFDTSVLEQGLKLVASPSLEFSDPPYRIGTVGGGLVGKSPRMKGIKDNKLDTFTPAMLTLISDTSVFCLNKPLIPDYIKLAQDNKVSWDLCVYQRGSTAPNYGGHMMSDLDYIAIVGKQSPNPGMPKETYSKLYVGQLDPDAAVAWAKPVALVEKFIKLYSNVGEVVVDRFGGSGTTLIACEKLERVCLMFEIDPKFADIILSRFETLTGQIALLV